MYLPEEPTIQETVGTISENITLEARNLTSIESHRREPAVPAYYIYSTAGGGDSVGTGLQSTTSFLKKSSHGKNNHHGSKIHAAVKENIAWLSLSYSQTPKT
ncbi:hypothetical protein M0802_000821 [Mischocyttarus mexicanus]|nr:hypothetical protein M0802_000821 [Mischocyttarus mexicanus]